MRILYHHRTLADGAEGLHIAQMVAAFQALGHTVHVHGPAAPDPDVTRTRPIDRLRAALPAWSVELASMAHNAVGRAVMRRDIDAFRPDLVYARHARFELAPLAEARRRGLPVVLEVNAVHSARPYRDFEPLTFGAAAERLERRAFELATVVAAVSTPLARQVRALAPTAHVAVLPNAVDPVRFNPLLPGRDAVRERLGLGDHCVIGWTGVLREWHGLDLLLEAIAAVPEARLLIVGDGPSRPEVERRAAALDLQGRMVITGRVPHADVPGYLSAMDVAVVAAERTGVASPMKLIEYLAMGCAVVAPRAENITDLVRDEETALLFEPGDGPDLAARLARLARDPALRQVLGRRAAATTRLERTWQRNAERALALAGAFASTSPAHQPPPGSSHPINGQ